MQNVVARGVEPCLGDRYGGGWALVGARRGPTPKRRTTRDEGCSVYDVSCPQGRLSKVLFLAPSAPLCYSPPIHSITISKTTALRFVLERQGLFLFSLLALPLFLTLRRERGEHFIAWLAALSERRAGLFVLLLPLALMRGVLGAAFSAYQGWTDFLSWFVFFVYGYLFVADTLPEFRQPGHPLRERSSVTVLPPAFFNDRGDQLFVGALGDEYRGKIPAREHPGAGSHARGL